MANENIDKKPSKRIMSFLKKAISKVKQGRSTDEEEEEDKEDGGAGGGKRKLLSRKRKKVKKEEQTSDDESEKEEKKAEKRGFRDRFKKKKAKKASSTTEGDATAGEKKKKGRAGDTSEEGGTGASSTDGKDTNGLDDKESTDGKETTDDKETTDGKETTDKEDTSGEEEEEKGNKPGKAAKALHKTAKGEEEGMDDGDGTMKAPSKGRATYTVRVGVYEAKQLTGTNISPMCRVSIGSGISRQTGRRKSTNNPYWNYKFSIALKKIDRDELTEKQIEFSVIDTSSTARGDVAHIGSFSCSLGLIYAQPQHSILHKWIAIEDKPPSSGHEVEDASAIGGISGFVKVCVCVLPPGDSGPSLKQRSAGAEDVLFGGAAQFKHVTLNLELHHVADLPLLHWKKDECVMVEVDTGQTPRAKKGGMGRHRTKAVSIQEAHLGERVSMPIMWPTVSNSICFRLYVVSAKRAKKLKNNRWVNMEDCLIAHSTLLLRDICAPGEDGYMPSFGPAYMTFYGADASLKKGKKSRRKQIEEGQHFIGRMLVAVTTDEASTQQITSTDIAQAFPSRAFGGSLAANNGSATTGAESSADERTMGGGGGGGGGGVLGVQKKRDHVLYCVFDQAVHLHHSLQVSIGAYGNGNCQTIDRTSNCTPYVTPVCNKGWTGYSVPWGSHKPTAEVHCSWEMCWHRLHACSFLLRLAHRLVDAADQAKRDLGFDAQKLDDPLCGVLLNALIMVMHECMQNDSPVNTVGAYDREDAPKCNGDRVVLTELDRLLCERRLRVLKAIHSRIWASAFLDLSPARCIALLSGIARESAVELSALARDPQMSIPDIHILLVSNLIKKQPIAFCRIAAENIYFTEGRGTRGLQCAQPVGAYMRWVAAADKNRGDTMAAFLHVRLFLAPLTAKSRFASGPGALTAEGGPLLEGCQLTRYAEVWENQKWRGKWEATTTRVKPFTNEDGSSVVHKDGLTLRSGFKWLNSTTAAHDWQARSSHDFWTVEGRAGRKEYFEEEAFEVQHKRMDEWEYVTCTDKHGNELAFVYENVKLDITPNIRAEHMAARLSIAKIGAHLQKLVTPPTGFHWTQPWRVDSRVGDLRGWTYAMTEGALASAHVVEGKEMVHHKHRRRRWVGTVVGNDAHKLDRWEYCAKFGGPTHTQPHTADWSRRQRWLRVVVEEEEEEGHAADVSPITLQYPIVNQDAAKTNATTTATDTDGSSVAVDTSSTLAKNSKLGRLLFSARRRRQMQMYMSPRIYLTHEFAIRWELRSYIFWGRNLQPMSSRGRVHAYAKLVFMDRCASTAAVLNNINPIFNESICFPRVLLVGSPESLTSAAPRVLVEVYSANVDGPDDFIGRFDAVPHVYLPGDHLWRTPRLTWYTLTNLPKTTVTHGELGSLMCTFVLYHAANRDAVPFAPDMKSGFSGARALGGKSTAAMQIRYVVPEHIKLKFVAYDIQLVTFGVRKLKKHNLTMPRRPFVSLAAGDQQQQSAVIADAKQCPNWPDDNMMIVMMGVMLPENLHQMPPLLLTLNNVGVFGSRPVLGTCEVDDVHSFIVGEGRSKEEGEAMAKTREDSYIALEKNAKDCARFLHQHEYIIKQRTEGDQMKLIDWWSKYYTSMGEERKAPSYKGSGLDRLRVFECALEQVDGYDGFSDFATSFDFVRGNRRGVGDGGDVNGTVKGRLVVVKRLDSKLMSPLMSRLPPGISALSGKYIVRVYLVAACDLVSRRRNGKCCPYVSVAAGRRKAKHKRSLAIDDSLDPTFGVMIELETELPRDANLSIFVKDKRKLWGDEVVGYTEIDLENRWLTKHRATVGLAQQYSIAGVNKWRDQRSPLVLLLAYCRLHALSAPLFVRDDKQQWKAVIGKQEISLAEVDAEIGGTLDGKLSPFGGEPRERLALAILHKMCLVPEHVEQRPLTNSANPGVTTGTLTMWVDILPASLGAPPPPVDITPRQPQQLQLRVVIWNVRDALMEKISFGEASADLFVKAFVEGADKAQKTDVHYRSMDGSGMFNWRFVFNLAFDPWESVLVVRKRAHWWQRRHELRVPPVLVVQLWDNHKFSADGYIGQMRVNLLDMDDAQPEPHHMRNVEGCNGGRQRRRGHNSCRQWFCCGCFPCCSKKKRTSTLGDMPDYLYDVVERDSMFERRRAKGWFPCTRETMCSKGDETYKKTDDDVTEGRKEKVTGKVELEMDLVDRKAADKNAVGKGRKKPNHDPVLTKPMRPGGDSWWITSRIKAVWKRTRGWWLMLMCVAVLVGIVLVSFLLAAPEMLMMG